MTSFPMPEVDMWCLTCDRAGRRHHVTSLQAMTEHYKAEHADVDVDALDDHEIVTVFEHRLQTPASTGTGVTA